MVEVHDETNRFEQGKVLVGALEKLLSEWGENRRGVGVIVVTDDSIRARNRADRNQDETTDVLSYPTMEPDDVGMPVIDHLGDIFISLDTAERQAISSGHALLHEVLVLAAHGLTHLIGHDHPNAAAWRPFRAAERRILQLAGCLP